MTGRGLADWERDAAVVGRTSASGRTSGGDRVLEHRIESVNGPAYAGVRGSQRASRRLLEANAKG